MEFNTGCTTWTHNKTGKLYYVIIDDAIECTNGREDKHYVVYMSAETGLRFCREHNEFLRKFTKKETS